MERSADASGESAVHSAARRVSRGLMEGLEQGRVSPGQRLVETDLAAEYGVGRNAVREAIQWLAAHNAVDVVRFRSASIRRLGPQETLDVLSVAEPLTGLTARAAAERYDADRHAAALAAALGELVRADDETTPGAFSRGRRHFYRTMLEIGDNRELDRLFPALGLHILHAQYRSAGLRRARLQDFHAMAEAIRRKDSSAADAAGRIYVQRLREAVQGAG